ncbi:MAG: site-specific integrase [Alphaproteobacteria bacterium]|nr:site-specific integrase [Alphaproteobacteria bacterium]
MSVYTINRKTGRSWMIDFEYIDPVTQQNKRYRKVAKGVKTKREAKILENELRIQLETPPPPAEEQEKDADFGAFAGHWLTTREVDWKPTARRGYEQILRVHLVPVFEGRSIRSISVEEVQQLKAKKLRRKGKKGLSPKTVNNILGVLSSLFEDAVKWRYAAFNPVRSVKKCRPDVDAEDFKFWKVEESDAFLEAIHEGRPRWYPFFLTALRTGMRLGELAALRWEDVDFERDRIRVCRSYSHGHETSPKSGRSRTLPMTQQLALALREHKLATGGGERVFLSEEGELLDHNTVKHHFWFGTRAAGVKRIRFHDLRHSFASQLVIAGASIYKVQKLLGHQDVKTTMRYAHLSPEAQEDVVALLETGSQVAARLRNVPRILKVD